MVKKEILTSYGANIQWTRVWGKPDFGVSPATFRHNMGEALENALNAVSLSTRSHQVEDKRGYHHAIVQVDDLYVLPNGGEVRVGQINVLGVLRPVVEIAVPKTASNSDLHDLSSRVIAAVPKYAEKLNFGTIMGTLDDYSS